MIEKPKSPRFEDLTGRVFGKLTVIEFTGARNPTRRCKRYSWLCRCECGIEKIIVGMHLKNKNTTSCGCYHKLRLKEKLIDLTGRVFGKLTVIERVGMKGNEHTWKCLCECGKESIVMGNNLRSGKIKSCNCRRGNFTHGLWGKPGYKTWLLSDPVKRLRHNIGRSVRTALRATGGSKKGDSVFQHLPYTPEELKLHLESLWEPWMNWGNYGGRNNSKKRTWHIDHIALQSKFLFTDLNDPAFLECWGLKNLRPLEKHENMRRQKK